MTRETAITAAEAYFDSGALRADLARRVAMPTESQNPDRQTALLDYLEGEIKPAFEALGFSSRLLFEGQWPFLLAERFEDGARPTVLGYGHGDVVRGLDENWDNGLSPWQMTERDGRWYGRGVADNKGQHTICMGALRAVLQTRGSLGFNAKFLIEMGEERISPGLHELAIAHRNLLGADVLIASDGPRLSAGRPTVFLGSRGSVSFDMWIDARKSGHHSGNWGGVLSDPAIQMAHVLTTIAGPNGEILIKEWRPENIPANVRQALADCELDTNAGEPQIDPDWGEPGLTPAERLFAWCSFTVLAMEAGNPKTPVGAIPPRSWARCNLRFVVGVDPEDILPALRRHLDRNGYDFVQFAPVNEALFPATRLDPGHPWVKWTVNSINRTTGKKTAILPNLGGSLPNDIFAEILDLPTVWVPHSYPACSQHAPNEHLPLTIAREGLAMMAGLYWDLGEPGVPVAPPHSA